MSEQNILNPTADSLLNPLYGWQASRKHAIQQFKPLAGIASARLQAGAGISYQLTWDLDDVSKFALEQWEQQYLMDFFTLVDWAKGRYFSGRFGGDVEFIPLGNNHWGASAVFEELPGLTVLRRNLVSPAEEFGDAAWVKVGVPSVPVVTPNAALDPNGRRSADQIDFAATGAGQENQIQQNAFSVPPVSPKGRKFRWSVWLWAPSATTIKQQLYDGASGFQAIRNLTTTPQRFDLEATVGAGATVLVPELVNPQNEAAKTIYAWHAQLDDLILPWEAGLIYPNWNRDAFFLDERNGLGEDLVKLVTGGWTIQTDPGGGRHGKKSYEATDATPGSRIAEWQYFGGGCRIWSIRDSYLGIMRITITRVRDNTVVAGPTDVDLYSATFLGDAGPVFSTGDLPLDLYRVRLQNNGKNGSSSGYTIEADAIEVMR